MPEHDTWRVVVIGRRPTRSFGRSLLRGQTVHLLKLFFRTHKNFDLCSKDRSRWQGSRRCLLSVCTRKFQLPSGRFVEERGEGEALVAKQRPSCRCPHCDFVSNHPPALAVHVSMKHRSKTGDVAAEASGGLEPLVQTPSSSACDDGSEVDSNAGDDNEPDVARPGVEVETRKGKGRRRGQESRRRYTLSRQSWTCWTRWFHLGSLVRSWSAPTTLWLAIPWLSSGARLTTAENSSNICFHWRALDTGSVQTPRQQKTHTCIQEQRPATMTRRKRWWRRSSGKREGTAS